MLKGIIVGVRLDSVSLDSFNEELEELTNLALACDIEICDRVTQNLPEFNKLTYVGKGKVEEIAMTSQALDADVLIINDELTALQISNLDTALEKLIYDRTYLILQIFQSRAKTKEALIQVEIASLSYMLPRLQGLRQGLSRQRGSGGGFAHGRGAGETKLELDRRLTNDRMALLRHELKDLTEKRKQQRTKRTKSALRTVCLVGYTNSGKSTTLNALLKNSLQEINEEKQEAKRVFEKDMLFATLETSTRKILTTNGGFLITDTVGFIEKLPTHLVEAFKSTLEEITEADLIVHVVDASNPKYLSQIEVTEKVLQEIGVKDIPMIYVFNKIDKVEGYFYIESNFNAIRISAKENIGIDSLQKMILNEVYHDYKEVSFFIPYENQKDLYVIKDEAIYTNVNFDEDGIRVIAKVSEYIYNTFKKYLI